MIRYNMLQYFTGGCHYHDRFGNMLVKFFSIGHNVLFRVRFLDWQEGTPTPLFCDLGKREGNDLMEHRVCFDVS